nr:putative integron gene cassette protein [uncultured bacterium]
MFQQRRCSIQSLGAYWAMNDINNMSINMDKIVQAHQLEWFAAIGIFFGGTLLWSYLIKRRNNLSFGEMLLAIVGIKKIKRNLPINIVHALTIIIPVAIMSYVFASSSSA